MSVLRYGARASGCRVLGPGNRAVLWVYGCCFDCPGCIAESYRSGPYQETTPEEAAAWYLAQNAEGLTISGGEPMMQAAALGEMVSYIRRERDCGVIVYTGYVYEDLLARRDPEIMALLDRTDLLIDGPYRQELDRNQMARGSDNQRLIPLTERYRDSLWYYEQPGRKIELRLSEKRTLLIGVPGREQREVWRNLKRLGEDHGI